MPRSLTGRALAIAALVTTSLMPISSARAQIAVVDLKSIATMTKQLRQAAETVTQLKQQVEMQKRMLQRVGTNISPELGQIVNDATAVMRQANGIGYTAKNLSGTLDKIYPKDLIGKSGAEISRQQSDWEDKSRDARREAMEAQNAIAQSQARTQAAVGKAVDASQGAEGQTAAVQATNQLLAALSAQLAGLETLLVTQMRAQQTAEAERVAQKSAARARHAQNFGNTNSVPKYGSGY